MVNVAPMEEIAMRAVDRAAGQLEGFYGENSGSDELLRYIADRFMWFSYWIDVIFCEKSLFALFWRKP